MRRWNGSRDRGEIEEEEDGKHRSDKKGLEFKAVDMATKTKNKRKIAELHILNLFAWVCLLKVKYKNNFAESHHTRVILILHFPHLFLGLLPFNV